MFVPRHALTRSNMMSILARSPARLADAAIQRTLAALIILGAAPTASSAADCVERPNLQAAQDGHWYYRVDLRNHRKCWYLQQQAPSGESSTAEPRSAEEGAKSVGSFFSTLLARQSAPQQDTAAAAPSAEPTVRRKHHWALHAKRATEPQPDHADQQPRLDSTQREALFQKFLRWARQDQPPGFPAQ
jgi:hypothetical protein